MAHNILLSAVNLLKHSHFTQAVLDCRMFELRVFTNCQMDF
jgi:hypothetical protein